MYEGETEPIPRVTDRGRAKHSRDEPDDRDERDPSPLDSAQPDEDALPVRHGHGHTPAPPASRRVRTIIAVLLVPFALAAVAGVVLLYPFGHSSETRSGAGTPVNGVVTAANTGSCNGDEAGDQGGSKCLVVTIRMTDGDAPDQEIQTVVPLEPSTPRFAVDDEVVLAYGGGNPADGQSYQLVDFQRDVPLALLAGLFAVAVLVLGRWQGLKALGALVISFVVLVFFVLPAIIAGESPLWVAIAGAGVIMFVVLYLTHGLSARTSTAVLGTMVSLALIGVLGALWAAFANLTGLDEDTATLVGLLNQPIDTRGLLLAGVVIGALGVLDDVTVTQTSAVWELRAANPSLTRRQLYAAALRIGRDHVASAVNTLVMAYAGAALPLLLYSSISGVGIGNIMTSQGVAQEIVRTLVGSIGLVAAVPVTTVLAAAVATQETPVAEEPAPKRTPEKRRPAATGERRATDRDRATSREREKVTGRERTSSREKAPQRDRAARQGTGAGRDPGTGRERAVSRDPGTTRERTTRHDPGTGRERAVSRDSGTTQERTARHDPGTGRERAVNRDPGTTRERTTRHNPGTGRERAVSRGGPDSPRAGAGEQDPPRTGRHRHAADWDPDEPLDPADERERPPTPRRPRPQQRSTSRTRQPE